MSNSVRFYLDSKKHSNLLGEITKSAQNFGKFVELSQGENYYEFKVEKHLLAFPDQFVPIEFQRKIRPVLTKVTMVTDNYGWYGMKDSGSRAPTQVGSSIISYEKHDVMVVGKSLKLIIKAYLFFCKNNGYMPDYQKMQREQKNQEFQKKFIEANNSLRTLSDELKSANDEISRLRNQLKIKARCSDNLFRDAFEFLFYKEARILSEHKYSDGHFMSVYEAKQRGLM